MFCRTKASAPGAWAFSARKSRSRHHPQQRKQQTRRISSTSGRLGPGPKRHLFNPTPPTRSRWQMVPYHTRYVRTPAVFSDEFPRYIVYNSSSRSPSNTPYGIRQTPCSGQGRPTTPGWVDVLVCVGSSISCALAASVSHGRLCKRCQPVYSSSSSSCKCSVRAAE